ncbi:hypothetical protein ILYODFUR_032220 [Ilyodon furcidens]|uniref:Uncharacterized protein n=1 Tax=Ilyodon furcidens TaxID=33524 RepID=A0ABV0UAM2_9TELE
MLTEPNAFWVRYQMACTTPEQKVAVVCEQGVLLQSLLRDGAEEGRATQGGQVVEGSKTDNIDVKRECLRQALLVYLNEDPEKVVKERMDSDVDNGQAEMETVFRVFAVRREGAERDDGPEDVGCGRGTSPQ